MILSVIALEKEASWSQQAQGTPPQLRGKKTPLVFLVPCDVRTFQGVSC